MSSKRKYSKELTVDRNGNKSTLLRPCDNHDCNICLQSIQTSDKGILVTVPKDRILKLKPKTVESFTIKWDLSMKSNAFHHHCWDELQHSSKLSSVEKNTMNIIEETIEVYDSNNNVYAIIQELLPLFREKSHFMSLLHCMNNDIFSSLYRSLTYMWAQKKFIEKKSQQSLRLISLIY